MLVWFTISRVSCSKGVSQTQQATIIWFDLLLMSGLFSLWPRSWFHFFKFAVEPSSANASREEPVFQWTIQTLRQASRPLQFTFHKFKFLFIQNQSLSNGDACSFHNSNTQGDNQKGERLHVKNKTFNVVRQASTLQQKRISGAKQNRDKCKHTVKT